MSIKIEIGAVIATIICGLSIFHTVNPLEPAPAAERVSAFSANDYAAFDRDFVVRGTPCAVGLKQRQMCFTPSPLQARIVEGEMIPSNMPLLAAEFPILVALPVKQETQKLLRYGPVLALINKDSRLVEDVLYLDATSFDNASRDDQTDLAETSAPRIVG